MLTSFLAPPLVLLALGAGLNIWKGTVPNWLVIALLAAFPVMAVSTGLSWGDIGWHLLAFVLVLAAVLGLFALGLVAGGAGKLIAAISLWMTVGQALWFLAGAVGIGIGFLIAAQVLPGEKAKAMGTRFASVVSALGAVFLVLGA
jgi:prepilin peptidase CpaA